MPAPEGNDYARGNSGGGRPTLYQSIYAEIAYKASLLGSTDKELAELFSVCETTINTWKLEHEEFSDALMRGKTLADAEIAHSLFDRAKGATWIEQQAVKIKISLHEERVEIVEVQRAAPPDTQAASLWLRNRQPGKWREKIINEHTGLDGGPMLTKTVPQDIPDDELDARIHELSTKTGEA